MGFTWVPGNLTFNPLLSVATFPEGSVASCLNSDTPRPLPESLYFLQNPELKAHLSPGVPHSRPVSSPQLDAEAIFLSNLSWPWQPLKSVQALSPSIWPLGPPVI